MKNITRQINRMGYGWVLFRFKFGFVLRSFWFKKITLATTPLIHYSISQEAVRYHGYALLPHGGVVS